MSGQIRVTMPTDEKSSVEGISIERLRTIVQDCHLNFLIGAGTSSPFFAQLGDVETALTKLTDTDAGTRLARASLQGYFFEHVLLPNLRLLSAESDRDAQVLIKSYAQFMVTLNQILLKRRSTLLNKQVNIFTTNIDMAMELSLELLEIDTNDGFAGKMRPRLDLGEFSTLRFRRSGQFDYTSEIPTVNLFKIHGSAGWRGERDEIYFDHRLELVREVSQAYNAAKASLLSIESSEETDAAALKAAAVGHVYSDEVADFMDSYQQLQIVNPEKTKFASTVLNKTYYELIRRFANELEKDNSALFVHGFSFRDEHLLDLVLRSAAMNPTLQVIVICYSRNAHDEISALFPAEKVKNGNILLVQPSAPKKSPDGKTPEERKLSLDVLVSDLLQEVVGAKVPAADQVVEIRLGTITEAEEHV